MLEVSLQHRFDNFALDAAFEAPSGVTVLFGPSGSGKTTVLRAVAGLLQTDQMTVRLAGEALDGQPAHARGIGYVFQDARLFPHLSVAQNLSYARRGDGRGMNRIVELLDLGPLLNRAPHALSGGEAQRVAIGRALLSAPRLLCMDEPLASLDSALKARILPYLERLRDEVEVPILYVSHDVHEVARLATTLVVLQHGSVRHSGPLEMIMADPCAVRDLGVRAAGAVLRLQVGARADGLTELANDGVRLVLPDVAAAQGAWIRLRVAAQDIILATERPRGLSALNVLEGVVTTLVPGRGPGIAVGVRVGQTDLVARITAASAERMGLAPGMAVWAIVKATAFDPAGVGT